MASTTIPHKGKALVVEDEFLISLQIAELLHDTGFDVVGPAARVEEAVRLAVSEKHLIVAILDVNLAGNKAGRSLRCSSAGISLFCLRNWIS